MRVRACVCLLAVCLVLTGCSLFGKRQSNGSSGLFGRKAPAAGPQPSERPSAVPAGGGQSALPPSTDGLVAGQVLDKFNRKVPPVTIQVIAAQEGKDAGAPVVVNPRVDTDANGYFTILNLQPGKRYKLIARSKGGEPKMAGIVETTPPNPRLIIKVSEDFAGLDPAGEAAPKEKAEAKPPAAGPTSSPAAGLGRPIAATPGPAAAGGWVPSAPRSWETAPRSPAGLGAPVGGAPPAVSTVHPDRIAVDPDRRAAADRLPANIPPIRTGDGSSPIPSTPTPVPSCVLVGRRLENFALYDLNGKPWEFRKDRQGKVVLIDFWGTWCRPCREGLADVTRLHRDYGQYGLEVLGIACEHGKSTEEVAPAVQSTSRRFGVTYRVLLATPFDSGRQCPVLKQFKVSEFPTAVLVDETGQIIWRSNPGQSMKAQLPVLEWHIKYRLGLLRGGRQ